MNSVMVFAGESAGATQRFGRFTASVIGARSFFTSYGVGPMMERARGSRWHRGAGCIRRVRRRDVLQGEAAAGAGLVLDHDRNADVLRKLLRDDPRRCVRPSTGRIADRDRYRASGKGLGENGA
jgi:hypothetical protein